VKIIATDRGLSRRMAVKALLAMGIAPSAFAAAPDAPADAGPGPAGTVTDPDLRHPVIPWDRSLDDANLATLDVLCDLILPADERLPGASALGAPDFIDEWVSAPYETQQRDRQTVLAGLRWLDDAARQRFASTFREAGAEQQHTLLDAIAGAGNGDPPPAALAGIRGFARVRDLTAAAVWTTPEGMADLGYQGNVPLPRWDPPPAAVLQHLGLSKAD
jgi:hypothetical protein